LNSRRALHRPAAGAATLLLILAGCGPSAASPSATPAVESTPQPTAEVTASPEPTASPGETPEPTEVATGECTPGTPSASLEWTILEGQDGDYRFAYPPDWINADQDIPTSSSVSPETFAETGLPEDITHHVDLVRAVDGSVGVSAWVIEGVSTRTEALFDRELAWLDTQPQLTDVLDDDIEACFDGSPARGFSSVWDFPGGETYIVIFLLERNGKMYEVQLTANDPEQEVTFVELISSWEWTEPAGPPGDLDDQFATTDFKVVGMATDVDKSIPGRPNPATFQSVFPATTEKIYVIYELDDGIEDAVTIGWARDGRDMFVSKPFDYSTTSFAWGWITRPSGGEFATGSYQVTLTLETSGDTITVPFTVE
jgi:hypothetical protein